MPLMQAMSDKANEIFSRKKMASVSTAPLAPGTSLRDCAKALNIATTTAEEAFLDTWPLGLQEALIGAIRSAMQRESRMPVTISWAPAYDYEVQIWEAHSTKDSIAAMTILLKSPYPDP